MPIKGASRPGNVRGNLRLISAGCRCIQLRSDWFIPEQLPWLQWDDCCQSEAGNATCLCWANLAFLNLLGFACKCLVDQALKGFSEEWPSPRAKAWITSRGCFPKDCPQCMVSCPKPEPETAQSHGELNPRMPGGRPLAWCAMGTQSIEQAASRISWG